MDDNESINETSNDSGVLSGGQTTSTPVSNYSYVSLKSTSSFQRHNQTDFYLHSQMSRKRKSEESSAETILSGINDLVKLRKAKCTQATSDWLKYHSMYSNLDRILSKLPEETVEGLNFQFYNLAYTELQKSTFQVIPIEILDC